MTFLELVNETLRGLREAPVATWTGTVYSRMVASYINAVKETCEDAWQWHALRHDVSVSAVPGQTVYALPGTSHRTTVLAGFNTTRRHPLARAGWQAAKGGQYTAVPGLSAPVCVFSVESAMAFGDQRRVRLAVGPDAAQDLVFLCYTKSAPFSADGDVLAVPGLATAIIEGAIARARDERGEDGGGTAQQQGAVFRQALADAIAIDSRIGPDELIWTPV